MVEKKNDISSIGPSFLLMTAGVLFIYCLTGMTAARLSSFKCAVLFGVFVSFVAFYMVSRINSVKAGLSGLLAGIPVGIVSYFALENAFNSVQRLTIECFGIMLRFFFFGCLTAIVLCCISLYASKKFKTEDAVFAVLAAGFTLRTIMVLFTPMNFHQHDVSSFAPGFQGFHDDYIMYIYENWALPDGDVRDLGQLYHPPLHYILSALFFKLNSVVFPDRAAAVDCLKTLPFIWSSGFVLFSLKIFRQFKIEGVALVMALVLVCLHPQTIFLSIQVNNDALALMLFVAAIYLALRWYENPDLTTILFTALAIGCAMMTKLSMGFVAFPVGFLFLAKLIETVRKKEKKGKVSTGGLIKQFVCFGALAFPLGLWYPVKNFLEHGTPFTYVFPIDSSSGQDVWMYSPWQRLFAPSMESLNKPFLVESSSKPGVDYNIFVALLKTSLFDERNFESDYLIKSGLCVYGAAIIVAFVIFMSALIITVRYIRKKKMTAGFMSLLILCVVMLGCYISFCFKYPVVCTESFRYIAPVLPAAGVFLGIYGREFPKGVIWKSVFGWPLTFFVLAVFSFYGSYDQYRVAWEHFIRPH